MCGIHASISPANLPAELSDHLKKRLQNRGPDHLGSCRDTIDALCGPLALSFTSTVLALRGDHIARQPLRDENSGSILCWNGEAWRIQGELLSGNDTEAVFALLSNASSSRSLQEPEASASDDPVLEALRSIEGPFAFIYYDKPARRVYYGRDRLGRRSLLIKAGSPLVLSSIAESTSEEWSEVEADGCYSIHLDQIQDLISATPTRHEWVDDDSLVGF